MFGCEGCILPSLFLNSPIGGTQRVLSDLEMTGRRGVRDGDIQEESGVLKREVQVWLESRTSARAVLRALFKRDDLACEKEVIEENACDEVMSVGD